MNNAQIDAINLEMEEAKLLVKKNECLGRLRNNSDFKFLILDGYFQEEAAFFVASKANPALQGDEAQNAINKNIDGIGVLQQYFEKVRIMGEQAELALEEGEQAILDIEDEAA